MSKLQFNKVDTSLSFEDTCIAFKNKNDFQLKKSLFLFAIMNKNWITKIGTFFVKLCLWLHLPVKFLIKSTVFSQFCGGETLNECNNTIAELAENNIGTILDYSVEGEESEKSFDKTEQEILKTVDKARATDAIPFAVFKISGIGNTELLEKAQENAELDQEDQEAFVKIKNRLNNICQQAHNQNVRLFIDAEESWIQNTIDDLVYEMMETYNKNEAIIFNTYQLYRSDMLENFKMATENAKSKGYFIGAKLVRGAYMEKERERSHEQNYCEPVHLTKADTDIDYNLAIDYCILERETIAICLGTHNEYSCKYLVEAMVKNAIKPNDKRFYFAQLLGMSDNISFNLAKAGYNVAKYVPYGPVDAVMPYLIRRAAENTSIAGQTSREYGLLLKEYKRRYKVSKNLAIQ